MNLTVSGIIPFVAIQISTALRTSPQSAAFGLLEACGDLGLCVVLLFDTSLAM